MEQVNVLAGKERVSEPVRYIAGLLPANNICLLGTA
jgi:hypothetical protein